LIHFAIVQKRDDLGKKLVLTSEITSKLSVKLMSFC
jgi:hypothetical protein